MASNFVGKISVTPRGIVSVKEGLGVKKTQTLSHTCLSFQTSRPPSDLTGYDFPVSSDCPPVEILRAGYGLLGKKPKMSRKSANNALERMSAIELEYQKENCLFITLTLPSDVPRSYEVLARYSSFCVNRLNQYLKDNYGKENFARVCVWEYQKRGAPHLHMAVGVGEDCNIRRGGASLEDSKDAWMQGFRRKLAVAWMHILESVGELADIDMFDSRGYSSKDRLLDYEDLGRRFCNVQVVEKSIAAYLGSYLAGSNHDKNSLRVAHPPIATWAQWDRKATELCNKYSVDFSMAVMGRDYKDWQSIKEILFGAVGKAEGTERIHAHNPFWHTTTVISALKGVPLVDTVKDFVSLLNDSGLRVDYFDVYRVSQGLTQRKDYQLEADIHDLEFDKYLAKRAMADALVVPICWDIMEMYCLIEEMQDIIETQEYSHNEQIRLIHEKDSATIPRYYPSCKLNCQGDWELYRRPVSRI